MRSDLTATYSPEDNKLRLYSATRLDAETYERVRAAGFRWAPKQELFVCPAWSPAAADLCVELCGEIDDEGTSLEDRATARAERFAEYHDKRNADAERASAHAHSIMDGIPLGQPILVGHHSERHARKDAQRIDNALRKAVNMWDTAKYWQQRAAGVRRSAAYKAEPAVRARRIKGLESELRGWIRSYTPDKDGLRIIQAESYEAGAPKVAHVWCGHGRGGSWVAEHRIPELQARAARWESHLRMRIEYERALLAEDGAESLLDKPKRAKLPPLLNYTSDTPLVAENRYRCGETTSYTQVPLTSERYAKIPNDYKGTQLALDGSHRFRVAMARSAGVDPKMYGGLVAVFLIDSKVHERPAEGPPRELPRREPQQARQYAPRPVEPANATADAMRAALNAGVQVVSAPNLFPTPPELARRVVTLAGVRCTDSVLEPSAGTGALLDALPKACNVRAVEVNDALARALCARGVECRSADFLALDPNAWGAGFDRIVINPPFDHGTDIEHVEHALRFLNPGGVLVAIVANGPKQADRLKPRASSWEELPPGTFAGTSVRAALLRIDN